MDRKILITNDDGINSDGIIRLAQVAKKFGQVWVIAPDGQRSAMSHSITLRSEIYVEKVDFPVEGVLAYALSGTPADCVRVGGLNLMEGTPDVVISGINFGYNCASDIQYSATAGAAFEATFQGWHAIAVSEGASDCHEVTDYYLEQILEELLEEPLASGQIWNVNFPECKLADCKGVLRNRKVSKGAFFHDSYDEMPGKNGKRCFIVHGQYNEEAEEETDFRAIIDGYVSVGCARNIG